MNKIELVRHGQVAAYRDSVSEYEITSDEGFDKAKAFALEGRTSLKNEVKRDPEPCNDGRCGSLFGLDTFFWFGQRGPSQYVLKICTPYND